MAFRMSDRDKAAIQAAAAIRQSNQAQADYDALMPQAMAKIGQAQQGPSNPLEAVLSGIGNSIKNVGDTLYDIGGTGIASIRDLVTGNAGKSKYQNEWKEYRKKQMGDENMSDKDYYAKTGGKALDAASTVSDFIPGLGTGAKVALNVGQGAVSGIANPFIEKGGSATLEDAMKGALVGGASAGVGQYVGGKLAKMTPSGSTNKLVQLGDKIATSNVGKGALTGAAAGAAGGGLYSALNGGDVLAGVLQGAQGGGMSGVTMAGTMGILGSGIDRLNRKYNAEPQTPDIPAAKPIVDEVAEQYTKPATIETALQEAQTPTRRQIDVQYDGSGNGDVAVSRQRRNMYRLPDRSGSTLDGILGPNNKTQLPNAQRPTNPYTKMTDIEVLNDISPSGSGVPYKSLADAIQSGDFLGDDPKSVMAFLKEELPKETYDNIKSNIQDRVDLDNMWAGEAYGVSKGDLPYLNRDEYYRDTIGRLGNKGNGNLRAEDVPESMYNRLRNSAGKNSLGGSMTDNESILRELFGNAAEGKDKYELYDMYQQVAEAPGPRTYNIDDITAAVTNNEYNNNLGDQALNAIVAPFRQDAQPTSRQIGVQSAPSIADSIDVSSPNRGRVIQDVMPAQRRQAQPQVQAQPIQETPTPRTPAQPVADEPIAVTDRAEFDRRYKADNYRTKAAQRTLAQFGNVDAPAKRSAKAIETAKFMNGLDLFKKGDIDYAAETVTGRNGAIAQAVTKAAQDADPVKINFKNVSEGVQRGLATSSLTDAKKKAVATSINAYNERLSSLANPDGTISPNDVLNTIRNVESDAATLLGKDGSTYRRPTSTDTRMAHVLQDYARDLQDIVDDNVNIKGVITPELSAQLKNAQPGNQKWAEWVDKTLDGAKTVKDLRKAQAPFVRMARFAENAEAQSTNNLPTTKSAILNQAVAGIVNSNDALARRARYNAKKADAVMASNSNGVKGKVGDVAKNIASKAGKAAEMLDDDTLYNARIGGNVGEAYNMPSQGEFMTRQLARQAGLGAARYQDTQNAIQNATQEAQDIQNNYENSMLQAQQMYNQAQQVQDSVPSTLDRIGAGMERALAAGDIEAYSTLADLYKQAAQMYQLQNSTTQSEAKALSANQSKALTGLQQLQTLSGMTPDLGTALSNSPLGGLVDMLGGNDYANQAKSLALTLGYLQSGANITPREAENIGKSYIPSAYDSENVRQQKLSRAEQLLRNYLADTGSLQAQ